MFSPPEDPGPSFANLANTTHTAFGASQPNAPMPEAAIPHGTTVVAVTYTDGVVLAGDRRATAGNLISHRTMRKVFPADRWSGVALSLIHI